MTDDQQLISEACARVAELRSAYPVEMGPMGGDHGLIEDLTAALSTAAVRYRAEGINAAANVAENLRPEMGPHVNVNLYRQGRDDALGTAAHEIRALLDENNETQEN